MIVNITATLGTRGQVLQVHAGSAKAAVGTSTPLVCPPGFGPRSCPSLEACPVHVKPSPAAGSAEAGP